MTSNRVLGIWGGPLFVAHLKTVPFCHHDSFSKDPVVFC